MCWLPRASSSPRSSGEPISWGPGWSPAWLWSSNTVPACGVLSWVCLSVSMGDCTCFLQAPAHKVPSCSVHRAHMGCQPAQLLCGLLACCVLQVLAWPLYSMLQGADVASKAAVLTAACMQVPGLHQPAVRLRATVRHRVGHQAQRLQEHLGRDICRVPGLQGSCQDRPCPAGPQAPLQGERLLVRNPQNWHGGHSVPEDGHRAHERGCFTAFWWPRSRRLRMDCSDSTCPRGTLEPLDLMANSL